DLLDPIREWRNWSLRAVRRGKDPALEADRDRGGPLLQDPLERSAISREGAFKYADAPYVHGHGAAVDTHLCRQAEHALIRAVEGRCLAKMQRGAQIYLASRNCTAPITERVSITGFRLYTRSPRGQQ